MDNQEWTIQGNW